MTAPYLMLASGDAKTVALVSIVRLPGLRGNEVNNCFALQSREECVAVDVARAKGTWPRRVRGQEDRYGEKRGAQGGTEEK